MPARSSFYRAILIAIVACVAQASAAHAQEATRRPFRRIFGGEPERPGQTNRLDIRLSGAVSYDDQLLAEPSEPTEAPAARGGGFPSGNVIMTYRRGTGAATLDATAATAVQHYSQRDEALNRSHSGGLTLNVPLGRRATFRIAQTASFATFSTLLGLPGSAIADPGVSLPGGELLDPGESYGVSDNGGWQLNTHAAVSREIGRRGSLEGRYGFARTDLSDLLATFNEAGIRYSHGLTRQAAVVAGYSYQRGRTATTSEVVFHNIDLGLSYSRQLPGLRNTSLSLSTGSALLETSSDREVSLLGDLRLVHLMGRTWTAALGYHRGVEFMSVLGQVVSSDSVTGTMNGFLTPRLETWISTSYSRGNLGSDAGSPLTSFAGIARTQFAISRRLALDAQYIHYFHRFGAAAVLPVPVMQDLQRNAVRVGLTLLLPVVR